MPALPGKGSHRFERSRLSRQRCHTGSSSVRLCLPELRFCGDNAAMIGAQGYYEYLAGHTADMTLNAYATKSLVGETL